MSLETKDIVKGFKKQPVASVCGLVSLVLLLSLYFRMGAMDERQTLLEERTAAFTGLQANISAAGQLDAQTKALAEINKSIEAGVLKAGALAENQQFFYRLEAATDVRLQDFRQQAVPAPAKGSPAPVANAYVPIEFSMNLEGSYEQVLLFMKQLEASTSLGRIAAASISMKEGGLVTLKLTVIMLGLR